MDVLSIEEVCILLEKEDPNRIEDFIEDNTIFHEICKNDYISQDILEFFFKKGADANKENVYGYTPFHNIAMNENFDMDMLNLFLNNGGNILKRNIFGETVLTVYCLNVHINADVLKVIISVIDDNSVIKEAFKILCESDKDIGIDIINIFLDNNHE